MSNLGAAIWRTILNITLLCFPRCVPELLLSHLPKIYGILPMHSNLTIKNAGWPHFSWATLYINIKLNTITYIISTSTAIFDFNCLLLDWQHWQIPLSKRFRALKLWFVMRSFGIQGLQQHVREVDLFDNLLPVFVCNNVCKVTILRPKLHTHPLINTDFTDLQSYS